MQGLRTEHQIDVRRALQNRFAFLRGDTATDADDDLLVLFLQRLPASELTEHLLLRLLTNRAGVDQDDVGLGLVVGQFQAMGLGQHVGHFGRVVLVHLTAVGFDAELSGHGAGR